MLTINATYFFIGMICLGISIFLIIQFDNYYEFITMEENNEKNVEIHKIPKNKARLLAFIFVMVAFIQCVVMISANSAIFWTIFVADAIVWFALFIVFGVSVTEGEIKFFSWYLYCLVVGLMVLVYSVCIRTDIDEKKYIKLSEEYQVENTTYYEYGEI